MSSDEYIYCEKCASFVYEYCSIHGPYLVIPDDKVSNKLPPFVPHAALTIPSVFLHIAPSRITGAGLGVFSSLTLPRGVRFGPYRGRRAASVRSQYCWQIYDRFNKPSHVVDAVDPNNSNWMRYVNCARHWTEQNLVAYQYRGQLYYRTIKIVPPFTELLVFYGVECANSLKIDLHKYNVGEIHISITDAQTLQETPNCYIQSKIETVFEKQDGGDVLTDNTWKCQICQRILSKKTRQREHYSTHIKNFTCDLCPFKTKAEGDLKKHKDRHKQSSMYVCDVCNFLTNSNGNLNRHKKRIHKSY